MRKVEIPCTHKLSKIGRNRVTVKRAWFISSTGLIAFGHQNHFKLSLFLYKFPL